MLPVLGLFHALACPDKQCSRDPCLYSHRDQEDLPQPVSLQIPVSLEVPAVQAQPPKRQIAQSTSPAPAREPPRKLQRTGTTKRQVARTTISQTSVGSCAAAVFFVSFS